MSWIRILTDADAEINVRPVEPPLRLGPDRLERLQSDTTLDETTHQALRDWGEEHHRVRERREALDPVRSRRQREAAGAIALLLVGLPLYLYHWRTIRRERG